MTNNPRVGECVMTPATSRSPREIGVVLRIIRNEVQRFREPAVTQEARRRDPFRVLISCLISLRTKDDVTAASSRRLFELADTPTGMMELTEVKIAETIYPAGFYRNKAKTIREVCHDILHRFGGNTPDTIEDLLTLKGVGRKTANLVVTKGFSKPGICVDTHVHRISNRLGWVETRTPDETEFALREFLPHMHWIELNDLLVTYGQNICVPISPKCSQCRVRRHCRRVNVTRAR